jgi:hypothetical protein
VHPGARLVALADGVMCDVCQDTPAQVQRAENFTDRYMQRRALPAAINSKMQVKHGAWQMTQAPIQTGIVLREPTQNDIELARERFSAAMPTFTAGAWQALSPSDKNLAGKLMLAGFQPFHFTIMSFNTQKGLVANLYLNLQGRMFNAQTAMGATFGGLTVRPMTADERAQWQIEDGEVAAVATLWKIMGANRFEYATDIGRAGGKRDQLSHGGRGQPVAKANPQEQAAARARARVLINGAPLGVPIGTFVASVAEVIPVETGGEPLEPEQPSPALEEAMKEDDAAQGVPSEEEIAWDSDPLGQKKREEPQQPVLTPREIPAGPAAATHPFVVELQLALAGTGLWSREKVGLLAYKDFRGEKALMVMAREGHSLEAIVDAVLKAQPGEKASG